MLGLFKKATQLAAERLGTLAAGAGASFGLSEASLSEVQAAVVVLAGFTADLALRAVLHKVAG